MPALILGIFPAIYAITTGSLGYLLFVFFFTMAVVGDFMIIFLLQKENPNVLILVHPSEAGCFIYRKKEEIESSFTTGQSPIKPPQALSDKNKEV